MQRSSYAEKALGWLQDEAVVLGGAGGRGLFGQQRRGEHFCGGGALRGVQSHQLAHLCKVVYILNQPVCGWKM